MQEKLPVDRTCMSVYLESCLLGFSVSLLKIKSMKIKIGPFIIFSILGASWNFVDRILALPSKSLQVKSRQKSSQDKQREGGRKGGRRNDRIFTRRLRVVVGWFTTSHFGKETCQNFRKSGL